MAPHSSTLAWKIPWTEEPGSLHGVAKSQPQLSDFTFPFHFHVLEKEMEQAPTQPPPHHFIPDRQSPSKTNLRILTSLDFVFVFAIRNL